MNFVKNRHRQKFWHRPVTSKNLYQVGTFFIRAAKQAAAGTKKPSSSAPAASDNSTAILGAAAILAASNRPKQTVRMAPAAHVAPAAPAAPEKKEEAEPEDATAAPEEVAETSLIESAPEPGADDVIVVEPEPEGESPDDDVVGDDAPLLEE